MFQESVEHRVREVLEEKLAVIFEEFGIDKTGDVLDSAQAGQMFDDLYVEAVRNPDLVETKVDEVLRNIRDAGAGGAAERFCARLDAGSRSPRGRAAARPPAPALGGAHDGKLSAGARRQG
ncbi:MAG: hypothetical protein KatS3mg082_2813 [Nitrospiraceae bacterium]|nr:MAG: hypothetical protein KatS3mg082_2813 [Nitrospiraceae bacterium]